MRVSGSYHSDHDCGNNNSGSNNNCCTECKDVQQMPLRNRPGLSSLSYRIGTYSDFKSRMLFSLSQNEELAGLTTRNDDDLAIALLDCWATVADVLTFYQERIANEGFLGTAKERRSIKELAHLLGYELRPGVAASTFLSFTVEEAAGSVDKTMIPAGTKVQSIPAAGETPQVFETLEDVIGRPEWNMLQPLSSKRQNMGTGSVLVFKGTDGTLKPGDMLLAVAFQDGHYHTALAKVSNVKIDNKLQTTTVETFGFDNSKVLESISDAIESGQVDDVLPATATENGKLDSKKLGGNATLNILDIIANTKMTESQLSLFAKEIGWEKKKLINAANSRPRLKMLMARLHMQQSRNTSAETLPTPQMGFYVLKESGGFFGHNAPKYATLPQKPRIYGRNWDTFPVGITEVLSSDDSAVYLDNIYPSLVQGSWIVFKDTSGYAVRRVAETIEKSLAEFAMSAKVTGVKLTDKDLKGSKRALASFKIRETTAYFSSKRLELADIPIITPVKGSTIRLDRLIADLQAGQHISVTGKTILEEGEPTGVTESEIAVISAVFHDSAHTTIELAKALEHQYVRDGIVINANIAQATHGETKEEVLGSGNPSKALQEFVLKQKPLTFVSSSVAKGGAASTLSLYVDNVLWKQVEDLNSTGSSDRAYVIRLEDEDEKGYGSARIIFGDGKNGMRPSAGENNIRARYRAGMGNDGLVKAGQLSMLLTRPLGVKSVTNPVAASGAANPEMLEHARTNASLPLIAMGRIVSLKDFEDFARAFAGIGKAQATWMWDGERKVVFLTIASDDGAAVSDTSMLYDSLAKAIDRSKDPAIPVHIMSFEPLMFKVTASVAVAKDHLPDIVFCEVRKALLDAFSFESRTFAQPVALSEILSVIQKVKGVVAAHVDAFYLSTEASPGLTPSISAKETRWKSGKVFATELLTIDPDGIKLTELEVEQQ